MKLKALLPTLREKKRYIVFEAFGKEDISQKAAAQSLIEGLQRFLGEFGMARAGVMLLKDWRKGRGVLRVAHTQVDVVRSAVMLSKGKDFMFKTLAVSGSLEKLRRKFMED